MRFLTLLCLELLAALSLAGVSGVVNFISGSTPAGMLEGLGGGGGAGGRDCRVESAVNGNYSQVDKYPHASCIWLISPLGTSLREQIHQRINWSLRLTLSLHAKRKRLDIK
ncbi:uncharacterized protein RAG0_02862 [Rhynchosporium agropyri]|uniref:Uncharacterized protein n=1 Tax=Rhynchosporium agropyri TaxID=914238 RepID=A0A1E1K337_9HELO|nr:uncharacterized protein RAG0_02862 [Rhynchosporium agropyri]